MNDYRHHVTGFFAHHQDAESTLGKLVELGFPRERLYILKAVLAPQASASRADDNAVLTNVLVDGAIGTAVGSGVGVLAEVALVATNVSLFIASPLIAPLAFLGWGASLGGLIGAAVGAERHDDNTAETKGKFSALIRDAISSGQVVLVVETRTAHETAIAQQTMQNSIDAATEVSAV